MRLLGLLSIEEVEMIQQGQVFELKRAAASARRLWAYRYRVVGRGSKRVQRGGSPGKRTRSLRSNESSNAFVASGVSRAA